MTKTATAEKAADEAPTRRRRPRPLDRAVVVQQVTRLALMLRSVALIVENLAMDLEVDLGAEMPEALHVAPKGPKGATVHVVASSPATISPLIDTSHFAQEVRDAAAVLSNRRPPPGSPSSSSKKTKAPTVADEPLRRGMRTILAALLSLHPRPLTRAQVATLSGFAQSGTFSGYLSVLRTRGLIEDLDAERIALTAEGRSTASATPTSSSTPLTTAQLVERWLQTKSLRRAGVRRILETLVRLYPNEISYDDLAATVGMTPSGTFSGYLSALRSNALIITDSKRKCARAGESLFLGAAK